MKRIAPAILTLLAILSLLLFLSRRPAPAPGATLPAAALADIPVLVRMTAIQISESAAASDEGKRLFDLLAPTIGRGGTLSSDAFTTVRSTIDTLGPTNAPTLAAPAMLTLAGQPARLLIENLAVTGERHALEVLITQTPRADGSIDVPIDLLRKDVSGAVPIFLDDLGVPVGQRRAEADLSIPKGSGGFLVRRLSDGSVLVVLIEPSVVEPRDPGN
jgi:hypothetical protein